MAMCVFYESWRVLSSIFPCLLQITWSCRWSRCSFVLSEKIPDFLIYKSWAGTDRNMTYELPGDAPLASFIGPMRMDAGLRRYLESGVDFLVPFPFVGRENVAVSEKTILLRFVVKESLKVSEP